MSSEAEYGLILAFDSDSAEFTRGFEAGQLWERLERDGYADQLIHAENAEMVMRMAESRGRGLDFSAEDVGYGWMHITIGHIPDRPE
jgi:hypothetical protein